MAFYRFLSMYLLGAPEAGVKAGVKALKTAGIRMEMPLDLELLKL